jgi:hypothetical protein
LGLAEPAQLCNVWKIKVNFQHRILKDALQWSTVRLTRG